MPELIHMSREAHDERTKKKKKKKAETEHSIRQEKTE